MYFDRFKEAICATLVLKLLDFRKPFAVDSSSLDQAVGAVLLQLPKDKLHPVAYFSKEYCLAERKCPKHEKELLAMLKNCQKGICYLDGHLAIV